MQAHLQAKGSAHSVVVGSTHLYWNHRAEAVQLKEAAELEDNVAALLVQVFAVTIFTISLIYNFATSAL